jgi:hypothetical protein
MLRCLRAASASEHQPDAYFDFDESRSGSIVLPPLSLSGLRGFTFTVWICVSSSATQHQTGGGVMQYETP